MPAQDAHHEFERPALSSTQGLQSLRFDLENQPLHPLHTVKQLAPHGQNASHYLIAPFWQQEVPYTQSSSQTRTLPRTDESTLRIDVIVS